jgi:hypothetical protein
MRGGKTTASADRRYALKRLVSVNNSLRLAASHLRKKGPQFYEDPEPYRRGWNDPRPKKRELTSGEWSDLAQRFERCAANLVGIAKLCREVAQREAKKETVS